MSKEAIQHYESALKEAFPSGATGAVFSHWNEARKALAEQPAQQELFYEAVRILDNAIFAQTGSVVRHDSAAHRDALDFFKRVFATQPPAQPLTYCQECMRPNPIDKTACAHGITKGNT